MRGENEQELYEGKQNEMRDEELGQTQTKPLEHRGHVEDAVFGEIVEDGPNYRAVGWKGTVALMMKTQIGLGVLSIPYILDVFGMIPGLICLLTIGVSITWCTYQVGVQKRNHPDIYGVDDCGRYIFGKWGYQFFGALFVIYWIFVTGSAILAVSISLNAMSTHGACTAIFVAVSTIIGMGLGSIQTLGKITWLAWVGVAGILLSVMTLTISVGLQDRPAAAPKEGAFTSDYQLFKTPEFHQAAATLGSLVFAYCGTPGFYAIVSEMSEPEHYTRSLLICQGIQTALYVMSGIIVYYFSGSYVSSPALGSAGVLLKKVCYGFAFPGLVATTTLAIHVSAKYLFIRLLRGSHDLNHNTVRHWIYWLGSTFFIAVSAYVVASAIPVFHTLISLVGALMGTILTFWPTCGMWLYDYWGEARSSQNIKPRLMAAWVLFILISGTFYLVAGSYGSIQAIIDDYAASGGSAAWTCADNSGSV